MKKKKKKTCNYLHTHTRVKAADYSPLRSGLGVCGGAGLFSRPNSSGLAMVLLLKERASAAESLLMYCAMDSSMRVEVVFNTLRSWVTAGGCGVLSFFPSDRCWPIESGEEDDDFLERVSMT